jgi:hypothetical protein
MYRQYDSSNRYLMRLRSSDNIQKDKQQIDSSRRSPSRSPSPPKGKSPSTTGKQKESSQSKYLIHENKNLKKKSLF